MIEVLMLLIGARAIRHKWWVVGIIGLVWLAMGVVILVNALSDEWRIPTHWFTVPLLLDAVASLAAGLGSTGTRRALRFSKAGIMVAISLLIILRPWGSDMFIGFLVGTFLVADASFRAASAWVVRFPRWRRSLVAAGIEFLLGVWSFLPWPTGWRGEVGEDVGTLLIVTAYGLLVTALRIRRLPRGMPIARIINDGWPRGRHVPEASEPAPALPAAGGVTVHVWTPTGNLVGLNRGIARYVAALDEHGVVSTGHAALEAGPHIYISHYPAVEIDRDGSQFTRVLRATRENDVPGKFQPSYAFESAEWCPSSWQVQLPGLDVSALHAFWSVYRRDTTYNLTSRNCSSSVAKALDAALEGLFAKEIRSPWFLARLLMLPEFWAAGVIRRRAELMAWTPGLVLDYARALSAIIELPERMGRGPRRAEAREAM
ncbi:HdeD family acid-resistance protein [Ancylobacter oerskovii]|uniref:HdeD family acid-resistance protein n=1 Tax=Ancylobacter oerskovii TaxID=459519 RepID=A0ABW4YW92_9HYPH|nr:protease [Ancylobacter oerskovii]MBS7544245.1 protease [Ancylobacter oerskovii]